MSKANYPYAEDEFDAPSGPDVPRGVHRAPRSAWSRWWPFLVVILVVPAIAYGLVTFASRDNSPSTPSSSATSKAPGSSASTPSKSPSDDASKEPTKSDEPTEPTSEEPTAEVALATPVTVFNAAGISGLAAGTVTDLKGAGFTNVTAANFVGTKPDVSTVYYASDDLKPTADLVAETIGIDTVTLSESDADDGVSAVLITAP
ncbi:LytR C-terminal domain-containing protein [Cellulomonas rhizosphaerae]|uniref:LytR C-terminal domain-containing protein n=1 Tax=Cellulomonas rhizosphaerae TaxID=2293719 RepID=UPI001314A2CC|nr:LytR C-terminal domain-containing protein [Cellulomonas rhizosphaerae]